MEITRKNQPKRTKGKFITKYKLKHTYKAYLKDNPKDSDFYVDEKTYNRINLIMFNKILDRILLNASEVKLPYNMGTLSVLKRKMSYIKLLVDYKTSKDVGAKVYHMNDHSNGYRFKFRWRKHIAIIKNRKYYSFIPTRTSKRLLAKLIKEGKVDYFTL